MKETSGPSLAAGTRLGRYEIVCPIGAGGMGEVYRARDPRLNREVAIKVLPEDFACDPERIARFEREARAAGALNHPNIISVNDVGRENEKHWIASELVSGETLQRLISRGPLAPRKSNRDRYPNRGWTYGCACRRHRASRSEAGQRHGHSRRTGENPGLWVGQTAPDGYGRGRHRDGGPHRYRRDYRNGG